MTQTTHFGLYKPDDEDTVSVTRDIGQNMELIDTALYFILSSLAHEESGATTSQAYAANNVILRNGELFRFTAATPAGTAITEYNGLFLNAPTTAGTVVRIANDIGDVGVLSLFKQPV